MARWRRSRGPPTCCGCSTHEPNAANPDGQDDQRGAPTPELVAGRSRARMLTIRGEIIESTAGGSRLPVSWPAMTWRITARLIAALIPTRRTIDSRPLRKDRPTVMAGLVPAIHALPSCTRQKAWMAGTSPGTSARGHGPAVVVRQSFCGLVLLRRGALAVRPQARRGDLQRMPVRITEIQAGAAMRPSQATTQRTGARSAG